ncbi:MAG: hypothetical protein ABGX04_14495 [Myxococcales bacterium]|nr:hypothetical protein [Myxococcales bacterium]HIK84340.1 hypothetical protein [Myxococcales bacterium]
MADEISRNGNQERQALHGAAAEEDRWLDRPSSINLIIKILVAACVLSVLADFFYHKHADYSFQDWIAFDAVFGFVAYVGLVMTAKGLRRLLMRDEDYYD